MGLDRIATVDHDNAPQRPRRTWMALVVTAATLASTAAIGGAAQAAPAGDQVGATPQQPSQQPSAASAGMIATQSSTAGKASADRAIDGITDGNFRSGSVTHTSGRGDNTPWLNVEFTTPRPLRSIAVWNRTDCCGDRMNTVKIKVSAKEANACKDKSARLVADVSKTKPTKRDPVANSYLVDRKQTPNLVKSVCLQKDSPILSVAELEFTDGPVRTDGDDVINQTLLGYHTQFNGILWAGAGDDIINSVAANLGQEDVEKHFDYPNVDSPDEWRGVTVTVRKKPIAKYERHIHAGPGDDQVNLIFAPFTNNDARRLGHHVYGESGSDTFNFVGVDNVKPDNVVVGRIDDFDFSRDVLQLEGKTIDPQNPPDGVRFVEWIGNYQPEFGPEQRPQIFILITNSRGGQVFYGLEGIRWIPLKGAAYGERHFVADLPDLNALNDVKFENTYGNVPYSTYANLDPKIVWDWPNRSQNRDSEGAITQRQITVGSDDPDIVDVMNANSIEDTLYGMRGDDLMAGGPSNDTIYGQEGNDRAWGGSEADVIDGGPGDDQLEGNWGADELRGGSGNDVVDGGDGNDVLYGDEAAETVWMLDPIVRFKQNKNRSFTRPEQGKSYKVPEFRKPRGRDNVTLVAVLDDDGDLSTSDVADGKPDGTPQSLRAPSEHSLAGYAVYVTGYYQVRNDKTGKVGRMYLLGAPRLQNFDGGTKIPNEFYVFDNASGLGQNDPYTVQSSLQTINSVPYADIAVPLSGELTAGDDGSDFLVGGLGDDRLVGGGGADVFKFDPTSGNDVVVDFNDQHDIIRLEDVTESDITISSDNTVLRFKGQSVTFATAQPNLRGRIRFASSGSTVSVAEMLES